MAATASALVATLFIITSSAHQSYFSMIEEFEQEDQPQLIFTMTIA